MSSRHILRTLGIASALAGSAIFSAPAAFADEADTMHLTDEPGNWFRSDATGTPVTIIDPGDRVDFRINNCCTSTRHTVTLLIKPTASRITMDQDQSQMGTLSVDFDVPGVYVLVCKVHPYMTAVVAVRDRNGNIPPVTAEQLPFLQYLGADSLPAETVLSVMTTVAATDDDKLAKWDIFGPADEFLPSVPGVGEVWISSQFERVPGQFDESDVEKPGTITIIDAATFRVEREINGLRADGQWNNPHNMWADFALDNVYNSNWFGKWINKIDRISGEIVSSTQVGEAPTHIITIPTPGSGQEGVLTIPLSADNDLVKVRDGAAGLDVIDKSDTGNGHTHPHGHWLTCGTGDRVIVPNVFKGLGFAGSISIMDSISGDVLREFDFDANDPLRSALLMPIAVGECHVNGVSTAYVANLVSGYVTVINVDELSIVANIPVTLTPDGQTGQNLLHTLQGPIQTPVSPDEKWVATAVLSLTTVPRSTTGSPDHVAIIDTRTNEVVKFIPTPAGTHGVNWGAKEGGGYYAYVTNQHANVLSVIDPDPNGDGNAADAAVVGQILLANGSTGAGVTDGTGGQGVKPLPMTHDGWIQKTVALAGTGALSDEVEGWIAALTDDQKDPGGHINLELVALRVRWGERIEGGLARMRRSDDRHLHGRSEFRFGRRDANIFELRIGAESAPAGAHELDLSIESHTDELAVRRVLLKNWQTNRLELIDRSSSFLEDDVLVLHDVDATDRVRPSDGRVEVGLRWTVVATFGTGGFDAFVDHVTVSAH